MNNNRLLVLIVVLAAAVVWALTNSGNGAITINAYPDAPSDTKVVAAAPESVAPEGFVGVLQAVGTTGMTLETKEGMQILTVDGRSAVGLLKPGDKVAVWAQKVGGQMVVTKIVVIPEKPSRVHYTGLVVEIGADRFDIVGLQGETTTFRFDTTLQNLPAEYQLAVGDKVTVVAKPDPLGTGWLAVAVVK